jgi:DNA-binding response OmpR family regulator
MATTEKRILVVDDDDAIRALLFTILRRRGFAVDGARNGEEALVRLRSCVYAAMLLDLMMPVKNGWEVLDELATFPEAQRPLVIVLTAGGEPRDLNPHIVAGSIRKPFDVEMLIDAVSASLRTVAAREQLPQCPPADTAGIARDKVN